ncbi:acyl-CoA dehydrogenase family protein [Microbacterium sp. BR1]|uniref:acyl-CoA dehydrogenase family protein n=1 Tax=Microbacterium sp. BR1 TaxID=1070896 RepID=UPI000C2C97AD|nr:acyl-CoA dehydrogenase family protein [Microbacterium sp. BR1]
MSDLSVARDIPDLLEKIRQIHPIIREHAAESEAQRHVAQETVDAMTAIGVFRTGVPKRFGGFGSDTREQIDVARVVAQADGGTAWVTGLLNSGAYVVGWFPRQAQEEVFSTGPDTLVSIVLAPSSNATKVDGGYRVTGEWRYNSGSWHSQWAILGAPLHDDSGAFEDNAIVLIPRTDLQYKDTWHVAGLKSTASNSFVAEDVFVPEHRVLRVTPAIEGDYPGVDESSEAPYKAAFVPVLEAQLLGAHLGMGQAVLAAVRADATKKGIAYTTYQRQSDSVPFQLALARAALLLEAAELFTYNAAREIDGATQAGTYLDYATRARQRGQQAQVVANVKDAIDLLMTAHGSAGFAESNSLQRFWRDQAIAARHGLTLPDTGLEVYGRWLATGENSNPATPFV